MNTVQSLSHVVVTIDTFTKYLGKTVAWAALIMVLVQFTVVLMRYVFGVGSIWMQESVIYLHSILFMMGASYTLLYGGHVRVDIFYREKSATHKAWVDLLGSLFLLIPVSLLIIWTSMSYVESSWRIMERSVETSGIPAVFLLKSLIPLMAVLFIIQGLSMALRNVLVLCGVMVPDLTVEDEEEVHG